jgi:hypothetical protein
MSAGQKLQPSNMAEQAQRRASTDQATEKPPVDNSARDGDSPDSHPYEELRHLIVGPEQEGLKEIQERLDDTGRRIEDVSSVVAEAIQKRSHPRFRTRSANPSAAIRMF